MQKKVFVGLSGGVDSAVSAALLKEAGYEVTGVFIKAWSPSGYPCTWKEDRRSAMRACAVLNIPFKTLDLESVYRESVVEYMIEEYKKGRTPNPDVMCNKEIKFGKFLEWAKKEGADYIATGHYAKASPQPLFKGEGLRTLPLGEGRVGLFEGTDKSKDQSYFLWTLTQAELAHILFPIGHLQKSEVRKLAQKFGLPQATRKDSQGLCFLGKIDMKEFLADYLEHQEGLVLNKKGEVIGSHAGAIFYTLGERHGFTIDQKTDHDKPYYVVDKDINKNTITVSDKEEALATGQKEIMLENINWIDDPKKEGDQISCRIRYRGQKIPCTLSHQNGNVSLVFKNPIEPIAKGQSIVFYNSKDEGGEICLGGGII